MADAQAAENNRYLSRPIGVVFLTTALPITLVILVSGLFNLVDAFYLGKFVSAEALTAVTIMFPVQMVIYALSTLVSNGFASIVARRLGAHDEVGAAESFAVAHILGTALAMVLMVVFALFGYGLIEWMTNADPELSSMAWTYMAIMMFTAPLIFILSVQGDALRSEGMVGFTTLLSFAVTLLNISFNYVFIVMFQWGVAGSAWGTVAAQLVSLSVVVWFRLSGRSKLGIKMPSRATFKKIAVENLALGAPLSLNYLSISLISGSVVAMLKIYNTGDYASTVGAYGIVTRMMTFAFMPLLGISVAFASIVGNNFGAKQFERVNQATKIALVVALIYSVIIQVTFLNFPGALAQVFVDDQAIIAETIRIVPFLMFMYFTVGPTVILSSFFQAIGDAKNAAVLSLTRNYLIGFPLLVTLPHIFGEISIWSAVPLCDVIMAGVVVTVLYVSQKQRGYRAGVFLPKTS